MVIRKAPVAKQVRDTDKSCCGDGPSWCDICSLPALLRNITETLKGRTAEVAQEAKCCTCLTTLVPSWHTCKSLGMDACAWGDRDGRIPGDSWPVLLTELVSSRFNGRIYLKNKRDD